MKFEKVNIPLNKNLYNKLNNICIFNNLKLEFKNGLIFKVDETNVNFIGPHRFIIKINDIALVLKSIKRKMYLVKRLILTKKKLIILFI